MEPNTEVDGVDLVAEATHGKLHSTDVGMNDLEKGWEPFSKKGLRVEIRTMDNRWLKGTVVETYEGTERGIVVCCDERWHNHLDFYEGRGATVPVYMAPRKMILSNIRLLEE